MAKRRRDVLRDEVISAARRAAAMTSYSDLMMLRNAFDAWDAELVGIIDTPGSWVEGSPETSRNAAMSIISTTGSVRRRVVDELFILRSFIGEGPDSDALSGLTCDDLEHRLHRSHQTVSSAVNWLMNAGWIKDSGSVRTTRSGRDAVIWTLSSAAAERPRGET